MQRKRKNSVDKKKEEDDDEICDTEDPLDEEKGKLKKSTEKSKSTVPSQGLASSVKLHMYAIKETIKAKLPSAPTISRPSVPSFAEVKDSVK